jgi:hypothetical protein
VISSKAQPKPERRRHETWLPARQGHGHACQSPALSSAWPVLSSSSSSSSAGKEKDHIGVVRRLSLPNQSTAKCVDNISVPLAVHPLLFFPLLLSSSSVIVVFFIIRFNLQIILIFSKNYNIFNQDYRKRYKK